MPIGSGSRRSVDIGAFPFPYGSTRFRVWAPRARRVSVVIDGSDTAPVHLAEESDGYFSDIIAGVGDGDRYRYLLDGTDAFPDPASRFQPLGVHGPSQIVDQGRFHWHDREWRGLPLEEYIIYELHVGTFTSQGTFDGVTERLDYLVELGVTAVELMPVAQFPGERNWGYDGTCPFAPQNSYGGPDGLKRLVDACHRKGLAVILDVVYNHLGPEGNYLHAFGPYFTGRYHTPWGDAVNFDGPDSDAVRHYFIANALYWINEYHMDALRLDAIHGIFDFSARHILRELADELHSRENSPGRSVYLIAESDLNDVRVILPPERGGHGLDAQWNDDFHHALHAFLTGERNGYYADFGSFHRIVKAFSRGFVLDGEYSGFRRRRHGSFCGDCPPGRLVVFSQNHDQVGNRMRGERPHEHLDRSRLMLAAAAVLLSPCLPLLFMGEEYGEPAPFPYFVSHGDPDLVEAVRKGRQEEFAGFSHQGEMPDPQDEKTFRSAILHGELHRRGEHAGMFSFYRELIRLRKELLPVTRFEGGEMDVTADSERRLLTVMREGRKGHLLCLFNFSADGREFELPPGAWKVILSSTGAEFLPTRSSPPGPAAARSRLLLAPYGVAVCGKG